MTCQQLIKHRTDSIHVCDGAHSIVIPHSLLGCHVTWRAQDFHRARDRALCLDQSREAEVGEMRFTFLIQQDISRFDVAMQNAVLVRIVNGACHLGDQFYRAP